MLHNTRAHASSTRCTVERRNGEFCDAPAAADMPFPICAHHAVKLYKHMAGRIDLVVREALDSDDDRVTRQARQKLREEARKAALLEQSVVYYLRMADPVVGDVVKIGYTANLTERLIALRANASQLLATEPGGRGREKQRHEQFAAARLGRREDFRPTRDLVDHIKAVRAKHGKPVVTGYVKPKVSLAG